MRLKELVVPEDGDGGLGCLGGFEVAVVYAFFDLRNEVAGVQF